MHRAPIKQEFNLYSDLDQCAEQAASTFKQRDWKWKEGVPTVDEIKRQLEIMRDEAAKRPSATVRCGGLIYVAGYAGGTFGHIRLEWASLYALKT